MKKTKQKNWKAEYEKLEKQNEMLKLENDAEIKFAIFGHTLAQEKSKALEVLLEATNNERLFSILTEYYDLREKVKKVDEWAKKNVDKLNEKDNFIISGKTFTEYLWSL